MPRIITKNKDGTLRVDDPPDIDEMQREIQQLKATASGLATAVDATATLESKEAELASLTAETERATALVEATKKAHADAAAESGDAMVMLEERVGELEAALQSKTNEAEEAATQAQEVIAAATVTNTEVETELRRATEASSVAESRVAELTAELETATASFAGVTAALESKEAELASLAAETERAAAEVEATKKAHADAAAESGDAMVMLEERVGELEAALQSKTKEAETATAESAELATALERKSTEVEERVATIKKAKGIIAKLKEGLAAEKEAAATATAKVEELEGTIVASKAELEAMTAASSELEDRVGELKGELETVTAASVDATATLESKEAELASLAAETERAAAEVEATKKAHADAAAESGDAMVMLEERVGELEAALQSKTNEAETATAKSADGDVDNLLAVADQELAQSQSWRASPTATASETADGDVDNLLAVADQELAQSQSWRASPTATASKTADGDVVKLLATTDQELAQSQSWRVSPTATTTSKGQATGLEVDNLGLGADNMTKPTYEDLERDVQKLQTLNDNMDKTAKQTAKQTANEAAKLSQSNNATLIELEETKDILTELQRTVASQNWMVEHFKLDPELSHEKNTEILADAFMAKRLFRIHPLDIQKYGVKETANAIENVQSHILSQLTTDEINIIVQNDHMSRAIIREQKDLAVVENDLKLSQDELDKLTHMRFARIDDLDNTMKGLKYERRQLRKSIADTAEYLKQHQQLKDEIVDLQATDKRLTQAKNAEIQKQRILQFEKRRLNRLRLSVIQIWQQNAKAEKDAIKKETDKLLITYEEWYNNTKKEIDTYRRKLKDHNITDEKYVSHLQRIITSMVEFSIGTESKKDALRGMYKTTSGQPVLDFYYDYFKNLCNDYLEVKLTVARKPLWLIELQTTFRKFRKSLPAYYYDENGVKYNKPAAMDPEAKTEAVAEENAAEQAHEASRVAEEQLGPVKAGHKADPAEEEYYDVRGRVNAILDVSEKRLAGGGLADDTGIASVVARVRAAAQCEGRNDEVAAALAAMFTGGSVAPVEVLLASLLPGTGV